MSASTTIAIVAAQEASNARHTACEALVQAYQNTGDVPAMQRFAECVQLLHPDPTDPGVLIALRILVVVFLVVWAVTGWMEYRDYEDGWGAILGGLMKACMVALGCLFAVGIAVFLAAGFM